MSWKPSELLVWGVIVGGIVLWRASGEDQAAPTHDPAVTPAIAKLDEPLDEKLKAPVEQPTIADVELAAEQLMLSVGGMAECKLHGVLPMPAVNKYGDLLRRIDADAFLRGAEKSVLILKGLALKPRSAGCKEVGRQLEQNAAIYREIAAHLP